MTGEQLDTNELMKIINLTYTNEDQDEVDIDSNLNLQDAIRYNRKIREVGYLSTKTNPEKIPCLKIQVQVNRRIVPATADPNEQYLGLEDFKTEKRQKDLFGIGVVEPSNKSDLFGAVEEPEQPAWKARGLFGNEEGDSYIPY